MEGGVMQWFVVNLELGEAAFTVQANNLDDAEKTAVKIAAKIISEGTCSFQEPQVLRANSLEGSCVPANAYTKDAISRMFPGHSREQAR
jgi:hypothetical protein